MRSPIAERQQRRGASLHNVCSDTCTAWRRLYLDFDDCLQSHKYTVFYGVAALTVPWSYRRKASQGPCGSRATAQKAACGTAVQHSGTA